VADLPLVGTRIVPALLVADMGQTLAFYRQLGFELTGCHPDPVRPTWAEVSRAGATFQFHAEPPHGTPTAPVCSGTFYLFPGSFGALAVRDPNGYYIAFTEPA
jgi:catechol 2,3-dioxygenase-like lactoylglutathione lyase family enzyme